jgi:hypothetical protein
MGPDDDMDRDPVRSGAAAADLDSDMAEGGSDAEGGLDEEEDGGEA